MNTRLLTTLAGAFGAAALVLAVGAAEPPDATPADKDRGVFDQVTVIRAADDTAAQAGVQPQGRGPVHEAFAEATSDRPAASPVVPKAPPEAVEEMPPAEKPEGDDVQWISGYWSYDEERSDFLWVTGIWRAIPPGRQWLPGHWTKVEGGSQWVAGFWTAAGGGDVAVLPAPPDPEPETPPPAPSADSTYVPGNQVYQLPTPGLTEKDSNRFVWQPGYYVTNRPGWVWMPAHYVWTPVGYVFVDGYWDYDVQGRGLLFAPVVIDARYLTQADWVYTPSYVVHDVCLLDALFVRRDRGCYFFGDYFDAGYADLGYVSWADYRFGRHGFDPLFSYYRWSHRNDQRWEKDLRGLYAARSKGLATRPPHNLAQQQTLARNLLAGGRGDAAALHHNIMLGPVGKLDHKVVRVQTLDPAGQLQQRKAADQSRTVSRQREQLENKLFAQGQSAIRKGGTAQTLPLNLPKSTAATKPGAGRPAPPPPPVERQRTDRTTGNTGKPNTGDGNAATTPGGAKVNPNAGTTSANPGGVKTNPTGNETGAPGGPKVNANAGSPAAPPGAGKVNTGNAPGTPGGGKTNTPATNPTGTPAGTKVNPGSPAGTPGGTKTNGTPGNPVGPPAGATGRRPPAIVGNDENGNPVGPPQKPAGGTAEGKTERTGRTPTTGTSPPPGSAGATRPGGPAAPTTPLNQGSPAGGNGSARPAGSGGAAPQPPGGNAPAGKTERRPQTTAPPSSPADPTGTSPATQTTNVGAVRARPFEAGAPTRDRVVQRSFTPPSGPRVTSTTPEEFGRPPSRPTPTFSSSVSRTSPAPSGGGRRP